MPFGGTPKLPRQTAKAWVAADKLRQDPQKRQVATEMARVATRKPVGGKPRLRGRQRNLESRQKSVPGHPQGAPLHGRDGAAPGADAGPPEERYEEHLERDPRNERSRG